MLSDSPGTSKDKPAESDIHSCDSPSYSFQGGEEADSECSDLEDEVLGEDQPANNRAVYQSNRAVTNGGVDKDSKGRVAAGSKRNSKLPAKRKSGAKRARAANTESPDHFMTFLERCQERDHEFFEKMAEKEGERELKSQQLMFSMVKETAKLFKGE